MKRTNTAKDTHTARDGLPVPRELVKATGTPDIVAVPRRRCLAIDGAGSPKDTAFTDAIGALYGTAYALKFARKRAQRSDFKVGPLEGHWSADVPPGATRRPPASKWHWRLRIGVPAEVTKDDVNRIKRDIVGKKGSKLEGSQVVAHVFLESVPGQRVGRMLHVGPYTDEAHSFEVIDTTLGRAGLAPAPTHIEVYLSDPSRTRPVALRTVLLRELQR